MADITPNIPEGRQLVQSYGDNIFRISGTAYTGSCIILPTRTTEWPVSAYADITPDSFSEIYAAASDVEVLLIGCGVRMEMPDPVLRDALKLHGIVAEFMDTGAACRTFNVLVAEDRAVAAALIAVP